MVGIGTDYVQNPNLGRLPVVEAVVAVVAGTAVDFDYHLLFISMIKKIVYTQ